MRKSTLFISAALTTFMLAVMFGVASAYQKIVLSAGPTEVAAQQQAQPVEAAAPAATNSIAGGSMTIEQAADLASNVIGRSDLYSAEVAQLDGVDSYLVTFSSGDIVYVSRNGQVMSISKIPVTYIAAPAASGWVGSGNGGGNNGGGSSVSSAGSSNTNSNSNAGGGEDSHEDGNENDHEDGDD
ncbi:MAG: hypothetical protein HY864_13285 [Chloroflexi bacterium]|nr:hypothetical protein [Chloroflexota bacterium]